MHCRLAGCENPRFNTDSVCVFGMRNIFYFDGIDFRIEYIEFVSQRKENEVVPNQYQLFDYLHSRFIDYRGLIDAGLVVDVNTLENNPYN